MPDRCARPQSRVLVERPLAQALIARLADRGGANRRRRSVCVRRADGAAHEPRAVRARAAFTSREARRTARSLVVGGGRRRKAPGYFVQPTMFVDVPTDSAIWREEIFGPVMCVRAFDTEDEAIALGQRHRVRAGRHRRHARRGARPTGRRRAGGGRRLDQCTATDLSSDFVGRLQEKQHRPRTRAVRARGFPGNQAGPERDGPRLKGFSKLRAMRSAHGNHAEISIVAEIWHP